MTPRSAQVRCIIAENEGGLPAGTVVARPDTSKFDSPQVFTIAGGHFIHDTFSAFIAPLLPLIQERLGTTYALTGGLVIFSQLPSILNPFIGYLADRVSLRYFVILAPGLTATLISAMGLAPTYGLLALLLLLAGVSIAAFHAPSPAMIARVAGGRVGAGMSIYMASGELGRTLGPVAAAAGVQWFGLGGVWRLAAVGWLVSGVLYVRLRQVPAPVRSAEAGALHVVWPRMRRVFPPLVWIMTTRILMLVALTTYLPLYITNVKEGDLWLGALALTFLEGAGVVGALATGTLSDRLGRTRVLSFLVIVSPVLLVAFLYAPAAWALPLLILLGLTAISPTPVLLAVVQDQFPDHRALANGTYIGLNFLIRAAGIWVIGWLADGYGLATAFLWGAGLAFLTLPGVWRLPGRRR
jgi:FSR family fosmidomycin resistance protein-like MFS transporter